MPEDRGRIEDAISEIRREIEQVFKMISGVRLTVHHVAVKIYAGVISLSSDQKVRTGRKEAELFSRHPGEVKLPTLVAVMHEARVSRFGLARPDRPHFGLVDVGFIGALTKRRKEIAVLKGAT
jgi:hypothetical protein